MQDYTQSQAKHKKGNKAQNKAPKSKGANNNKDNQAQARLQATQKPTDPSPKGQGQAKAKGLATFFVLRPYKPTTRAKRGQPYTNTHKGKTRQQGASKSPKMQTTQKPKAKKHFAHLPPHWGGVASKKVLFLGFRAEKSAGKFWVLQVLFGVKIANFTQTTPPFSQNKPFFTNKIRKTIPKIAILG